MIADSHSHAAYDELLTNVNIDDLEWPWALKLLNLDNFLAIFCCKRVNCDEMDGDRLRLPANRLSRVSWALAQISCSTAYNKQEIWANAHETRESLWQFRFSNLAEIWGAHVKLIYKYQILYLDRITIVSWRHLVNDIDLCCNPKSPKKP